MTDNGLYVGQIIAFRGNVYVVEQELIPPTGYYDACSKCDLHKDFPERGICNTVCSYNCIFHDLYLRAKEKHTQPIKGRNDNG